MDTTKPRVSVDIHPGQHVLDSFRIFRGHPFTLVEIATFGLIPEVGSRLATTWVGLVVFQVPFIIAQQVVHAALVYAAASSTDMTIIPPADVLEAYRTALRKFRDIVALLLREAGAVLLLAITIVGIPWSVRLFVRWSFAIYAIVLNDLNAKGAISLSCELVTGRWWQIAGLLLATSAPGGIISLSILILTQSTLPPVIFGVVYSLTATPLIATFWTLQFLELQAGHPDYQAEAMCAT